MILVSQMMQWPTQFEKNLHRRRIDPSEHALVAFGGAGGQHACGVASRLG